MFSLSVVDQVRLSFGSALAAYEGHSAAAARLTRVSTYARIGLLVLSGAAVVLNAFAIGGAFGSQIAAAIVGACVFASCATYIGFNQQPLVYGHRVSAARWWVICEKYRALLAEMHADMIDSDTLQHRRNMLLEEAAAILERLAPDDRYSYEIARDALSGRRSGGYADAIIDRYLPPQLRKEAPPDAAQAHTSPAA
jgi:hypothetical protein